ncbi:MAG: hypothetical protein MJY92_04105 [Bacteroidales bacterium]|nr:hypothetical protein [Bacteroidales bacterium]
MNKIIKWVMWALIAVGVAVTVYAFATDFSEASIDTLLYWAYAMVGAAVVSILCGIGAEAKVNPKALIKYAVYLVGAAALIGVAYVLAPGTPAIGYNGAPVTDQTLKLTDTILNLTYITLAASVVAILGSIVWGAVKGK